MRATASPDASVTSAQFLTALGAGLAGAAALTAFHETARRAIPDIAPRMDVLGRRAIARGMELVGATPPSKDRLQWLALAGDLLMNSLFYALVGAGSPEPKRALLRGAALGSAAGVGAVVLPPLLGLGSDPSRRTPQTKAMTVAWYLAGGLAAAGVFSLLRTNRARTS